ncbi:MAG: hypothetical protein JRH15_22635, partial [Deltaproteobacteria bacterium]|nr:hypothetical protein [Deltaproteobacteria bacterium]
ANDFAEIVYLTARDTTMEVVAVVDEGRIGESFFELTIESPDNLNDYAVDRVVLTDIRLRSLAFNRVIDQNGLREKVVML